MPHRPTIAPGHYDVIGFHATATIGTLGAAAACAHLLGLPPTISLPHWESQLPRPPASSRCSAPCASRCTPARPQTRPDGSKTRRPRLHQPNRCHRMQPRFRPHPQSGFPSATRLRHAPNGWWIVNNLFKYHASCYMNFMRRSKRPASCVNNIGSPRSSRRHHRTPRRIQRSNL